MARAPAHAPAPAPAPAAAAVPTPHAGVDDRDASGWTALQRAAEGGDLAELTALLDRGANLEASSPQVYGGATAMVIALEFSEPLAAKLLIDRGASVAGAAGTEALVLAARDGADDLVDLLLQRGVPVRGTRALDAAAKYGRVSAIQRLLRAGAPVNQPDANDHQFTPLMIACMENQLEAARTLLAAGANVNAQDDDGTTVLHWAVFAARPDELHLYRELGQPHDTVYRPQQHAPLVELLLARGAKLEVADAAGNTALHQAAMMDARAAALVLIAAGANRAARNREGKTAYELAVDRHNSVEDALAPRPGGARPRR